MIINKGMQCLENVRVCFQLLIVKKKRKEKRKFIKNCGVNVDIVIAIIISEALFYPLLWVGKGTSGHLTVAQKEGSAFEAE